MSTIADLKKALPVGTLVGTVITDGVRGSLFAIVEETQKGVLVLCILARSIMSTCGMSSDPNEVPDGVEVASVGRVSDDKYKYMWEMHGTQYPWIT